MSEVNDVESIKNKMENINHKLEGISPNGKYGLSFSNYDFKHLRFIDRKNFILWNLSNNEPLQCNNQGIDNYFSLICIDYSFSNNDKYLCIELKKDYYGHSIVIIINLDDMSVKNMDTIDIYTDNEDKFIFSNDEKYLLTLYNGDPDYISSYDSDYEDDDDSDYEDDDNLEYTTQYVQVFDLMKGTYIYDYYYDNLIIHSACFNNDNSILTLLFTNNELILIDLNDCQDYKYYPLDDDQDVDLSKISSLVISGKFNLFTRVYYFREKNDKYYLFFDQHAFEEFNFKKNEQLLRIVYSYDQSHKGKNIVPNNPVDRVFLTEDLVQYIAQWL